MWPFKKRVPSRTLSGRTPASVVQEALVKTSDPIEGLGDIIENKRTETEEQTNRLIEVTIDKLEENMKSLEREIEKQGDEVVRNLLRQKFLSSTREIIRAMRMFDSLRVNNREQFQQAGSIITAGLLKEEFRKARFSEIFLKRLFLMRLYLAYCTMINLIGWKSEVWEKAEMLRRLRSGMEDLPEQLLEKWITGDKEVLIQEELGGKLGVEIADRIKSVIAVREFKDACNTVILKTLEDKLSKASSFSDLVDLVRNETGINDVLIKLSLPEEMVHQFSFIEGENYPGAEVAQNGRTVLIKIDIRALMDERFWRGDLGILISRQLCSIVLSCMERHGLPESLHWYLINRVAPLVRVGGVPGFRRIKWEDVSRQAGLKS